MSELQLIRSALNKAAGRRRWAGALRGLWYGLLAGAIISLLLIGAYHLRPLPMYLLLVAAAVPFPCMLIGLIIGGWRKPGMSEVARWVDVKQHLQERLSTALEVSAEEKTGKWQELVVTDAAAHAQEIDPKRLVPFNLPGVTKYAVIVLALCAGLGFVPEYRSRSYLQSKAEQQNIKDVGKQLADLTKRSLEKRPPALETTQKSMEAVNELGEQMVKKTMTRSEALKDLANVADKLKQQLNEMGKDPDLKRMQQAARAPSGNDSQTAAGMQKQIESMQKQLGTPTGNPEQMDKLKKELEK